MSEPIVCDDGTDFSLQMRQLAAEAAQHIQESIKEESPGTIKERLDNLASSVNALSHATAENTVQLSKLETTAQGQVEVFGILDKLHGQLDRDSSITKKLFDAMHEELKGYKDSFLFEALQKPVMRDLITLYDDLAEVQRQALEHTEQAKPDSSSNASFCAMHGNLNRLTTNFGNALHSVLEILARREVEMVPQGTGKLDKRTQKAVAVEAAESEAQHGDVVRSLKPGFLWRGQLIRPEHVVIKKWQ
jgi:molecular chaperone GrpE (heat shock protein)